VKKFTIMVIAALPAGLSAQTAGNTLELVQGLSVSAASSNSLSIARESASKSFLLQMPVPAVVQNPRGQQKDGYHPAPYNGYAPGHGHASQTPPHTPGPHYPGYHPAPYNGYAPGHGHSSPTPPHTPGPHYPGYHPAPYNGYAPGQTHTSPVVSRPVSKTSVLLVLLSLALLLLLL